LKFFISQNITNQRYYCSNWKWKYRATIWITGIEN